MTTTTMQEKVTQLTPEEGSELLTQLFLTSGNKFVAGLCNLFKDMHRPLHTLEDCENVGWIRASESFPIWSQFCRVFLTLRDAGQTITLTQECKAKLRLAGIFADTLRDVALQIVGDTVPLKKAVASIRTQIKQDADYLMY